MLSLVFLVHLKKSTGLFLHLQINQSEHRYLITKQDGVESKYTLKENLPPTQLSPKNNDELLTSVRALCRRFNLVYNLCEN